MSMLKAHIYTYIQTYRPTHTNIKCMHNNEHMYAYVYIHAFMHTNGFVPYFETGNTSRTHGHLAMHSTIHASSLPQINLIAGMYN